ncbi:MAG: adenylyltransferase/cytidyltransferase family protein [Candidatus Thorarchaeota archaeon]
MPGIRVMAAGKFDILHLGHLAYLEQAKDLAGQDGELVVVIALDKTIERERGVPPVFPQDQRLRIVSALKVVDEAVLGYDTDDHTAIVRDLRPDIIALGYDQHTDMDALRRCIVEAGLDTRIVRLNKRDEGGLCSSSLIRRRIIENYAENRVPRLI